MQRLTLSQHLHSSNFVLRTSGVTLSMGLSSLPSKIKRCLFFPSLHCETLPSLGFYFWPTRSLLGSGGWRLVFPGWQTPCGSMYVPLMLPSKMWSSLIKSLAMSEKRGEGPLQHTLFDPSHLLMIRNYLVY